MTLISLESGTDLVIWGGEGVIDWYYSLMVGFWCLEAYLGNPLLTQGMIGVGHVFLGVLFFKQLLYYKSTPPHNLSK